MKASARRAAPSAPISGISRVLTAPGIGSRANTISVTRRASLDGFGDKQIDRNRQGLDQQMAYRGDRGGHYGGVADWTLDVEVRGHDTRLALRQPRPNQRDLVEHRVQQLKRA